ncbi:MAG: hypothetical protein WBH77_09885 [Saccharofermentanales bacterium]
MGNEALKIIIAALVGSIVSSVVTYVFALPKKLKESNKLQNERLSNMEEGIKSLLRNSIQESYLKICNPHRTYAKPYEKQNVAETFEAYKQLGGNSYINELYEQIMHKPVEPEYYKKERKIDNVNG